MPVFVINAFDYIAKALPRKADYEIRPRHPSTLPGTGRPPERSDKSVDKNWREEIVHDWAVSEDFRIPMDLPDRCLMCSIRKAKSESLEMITAVVQSFRWGR